MISYHISKKGFTKNFMLTVINFQAQSMTQTFYANYPQGRHALEECYKTILALPGEKFCQKGFDNYVVFTNDGTEVAIIAALVKIFNSDQPQHAKEEVRDNAG